MNEPRSRLGLNILFLNRSRLAFLRLLKETGVCLKVLKNKLVVFLGCIQPGKVDDFVLFELSSILLVFFTVDGSWDGISFEFFGQFSSFLLFLLLQHQLDLFLSNCELTLL